jgi:hypothetical protein
MARAISWQRTRRSCVRPFSSSDRPRSRCKSPNQNLTEASKRKTSVIDPPNRVRQTAVQRTRGLSFTRLDRHRCRRTAPFTGASRAIGAGPVGFPRGKPLDRYARLGDERLKRPWTPWVRGAFHGVEEGLGWSSMGRGVNDLRWAASALECT